ncbi:MAG: class I SAM-dependent methyltransferase [Vicinamibacterales bacterium]
MATRPIDPVLVDLATLLRCLACGATDFVVAAEQLSCRRCGGVVPVTDGIPQVRAADEDPAVTRERAAVREMEDAGTGDDGAFTLAALLADDGPLRDAFLALPYDDGSPHFRTHEYFRNVASFAGVFDYVLGVLGPGDGGRVLDVGADLTWSTARLAAAGWRPVGIDINDHLAASRLMRRHAPPYGVVNVDMHLPAFRPGAFDVVTAFNALHHTHRIEALVGTLAAMLRPGGRWCVVEPYWFLPEVRQAFGVAQIDAGINENVYRLEEWHRWFVQAGLELETHLVGHAFNAVYRKRDDGTARTLSTADAEAELFDGFYRAALTGPPALPGPVPPGSRVEVPIRVANRSSRGWSSDGQMPVRLCYHLFQRAAGARTLVAYEHPRTPLGRFVLPGATHDIRLPLVMPEASGTYEFEIDLIHEDRSWFAGQGATPWVVTVEVGAV